MPTLTVRRERGWTDKIRKYRILLDGVEIGRLGEGAELVQQITDEPHVIEAKIDWCGSRLLRFEAQSEDQVVLVRSALRGWRVLFPFSYVIFNRHGYLTLELRTGRQARRSRRDVVPSPQFSAVAEVACWRCKEGLSVTQENRGAKVTCPKCGTKQRLPV